MSSMWKPRFKTQFPRRAAKQVCVRPSAHCDWKRLGLSALRYIGKLAKITALEAYGVALSNGTRQTLLMTG